MLHLLTGAPRAPSGKIPSSEGWPQAGVGNAACHTPHRSQLPSTTWELWENTFHQRQVVAYPIIPYRPYLKEIARKLRKNMTLGEVLLWQQLKGKQMMGYDFDRQRPIDRYIVDFYCKRLWLAIEIDGSSHDSPEAQERDRIRQETLEALGVRFLRFREGQVRDEISEVLIAIRAWIEEHAEG